MFILLCVLKMPSHIKMGSWGKKILVCYRASVAFERSKSRLCTHFGGIFVFRETRFRKQVAHQLLEHNIHTAMHGRAATLATSATTCTCEPVFTLLLCLQVHGHKSRAARSCSAVVVVYLMAQPASQGACA